MPELPEVETTCRGIRAHILGHSIANVTVRDRRLRWPVPRGLERKLAGTTVHEVSRRAKYLLLEVDGGTILLHLGMSGSLRVVDPSTALKKHDHLDFAFENDKHLRLHDPRRFGCCLWIPTGESHPLLDKLGPEPLGETFDGRHLHRLAKKRAVAVKNFIMNAQIVVGVGNIYASEALFRAGIHPARAAGRVSLARYQRLAEAIQATLSEAIEVGGTTLRDFYGGDGEPGYFRQRLNVYERADQPCRTCETPIKRSVLGQRATYACPRCQR